MPCPSVEEIAHWWPIALSCGSQAGTWWPAMKNRKAVFKRAKSGSTDKYVTCTKTIINTCRFCNFAPKIVCAICVCLTSVSKGAERGFTSQLTYSFKHGYHELEVTDLDISWMGIILILDKCMCHPIDLWFRFRCSSIPWQHNWLFCWRLASTIFWQTDHASFMQCKLLFHMDHVGM